MSIRAAPAVTAKVHGHDAAAFAREMLELGREVGVIAGYTVDQQDGRLSALCFLVKQGRKYAASGGFSASSGTVDIHRGFIAPR